MFLIRFLKNWTLPCAMAAGIVCHFVLYGVDALAPWRPGAAVLGTRLMPVLIFLMLFFTFNKVDLRQLRPRLWQFELLAVQTVASLLLAGVATQLGAGSAAKVVVEAALACALCPAATASAVITGKLGGSSAATTTFILASNLWSAVLIALLCPLVEPHPDLRFAALMGRMFGQVATQLILPFLVAMAVRRWWPWLHAQCLRLRDISFYLWGLTLTIVTAQTARTIADEGSHPLLEVGAAGAGLAVCVLYFVLGKAIGGHSGDRISGGQALGQKNTGFAIWMAFAFLNPLAAIGPGSYVLWQNTFNSWQLWRHRRREERGLPNPVDRSALAEAARA